MAKHWSDSLVKLDACSEAVTYARQHKSFRAAWSACERPDWMLWYLGRAVTNTQQHRESLTLLAIRFVRAIPNRLPIPAWELWADAYVSGQEREPEAAAGAAEAAAGAEAWAAAWAAAEAAGAREAAWATWAAREAAWAAAANQTNANLIRQVYPTPPRRTR